MRSLRDLLSLVAGYTHVKPHVEVFSFIDLVEDGPPRQVLARVSFLSTDEGGRGEPCFGPYRPNHNFGGPEDRQFYIGQLQIPPGEIVRPGEARTLEIVFLNGRGLAEVLHLGRRWRIQEGARLVANAEVLELRGEV